MVALPEAGAATAPVTLAAFDEWLRGREVSALTRERYRGVYKRWLAFCQKEELALESATRTDIDRWFANRTAGPEAVRRDLQGLQSLYTWLLESGAASSSPAVDYLRHQRADLARAERSPWRNVAALEGDREFEGMAAAFCNGMIGAGLSRHTVATYCNHLAMLWAWCRKRGLETPKLTRGELDLWVYERIQDVGQNTVRGNLGGVKRFFAWLKERGTRPDDPTDGMRIKHEGVLPTRPFTEEEVRRLLAACHVKRDRLLLEILVSTGIRIRECAAMQVEDIDWSAGVILIRGKGAKHRRVAPPPHILDRLLIYLGGRTAGPVWREHDRFHAQRPISDHRMRKNLYTVAQKAGVELVHPHRFRATFSTYYLNKGGSIHTLRVLMGHESIETTQRYTYYAETERGLEDMRRLNLLATPAGLGA